MLLKYWNDHSFSLITMKKALFIIIYSIVLINGHDTQHARHKRNNIEDLFLCEHTEMSDQMANCEKGHLIVDVLRTSSSASYSSSFVDYEEMFKGATPQECRLIDDYATQLMCKHSVMQDCLADDYKSLLPNRDSLASSARFLCQNVYNLNEDCLQKYRRQFGACMLGMNFDNPTLEHSQTPAEKSCARYTKAKTCVATSFRPCGPFALKLYKQAMDYLVPMTCASCGLTPAIPLILVIAWCVVLLTK